MIKVEVTIDLCEIEGERVDRSTDQPVLTIRNHRTDPDMIMLHTGGEEISVYVSELKKAIDAVQAAKRY